MADLMFHIKDGYFFEVPKFMARHHWKSLEEVPEWLRKWNPEVTDVNKWNEEMAGKILIPQPFGTPKNLYESYKWSEGHGFCISRFMILELVVAAILVFFFVRLANKIRKGGVPRGGFWNFAEGVLEFLRENVIRPAIGAHDADRFVPLLWTMFFFILGCNLIGLVPWTGSPTGSFGVTLALAIAVFATVIVSGMVKFGFIGFWKNQVPHMDLPAAALVILWPMIFIIEVLGLVIRHGVLGFRLLANMAAGHLVLAAVLGLILVAAESSATGQWLVVTIIAVIGSALLSLLELFVAFLQAYVFTFLSALFIGAAIHHH